MDRGFDHQISMTWLSVQGKNSPIFQLLPVLEPESPLKSRNQAGLWLNSRVLITISGPLLIHFLAQNSLPIPSYWNPSCRSKPFSNPITPTFQANSVIASKQTHPDFGVRETWFSVLSLIFTVFVATGNCVNSDEPQSFFNKLGIVRMWSVNCCAVSIRNWPGSWTEWSKTLWCPECFRFYGCLEQL